MIYSIVWSQWMETEIHGVTNYTCGSEDLSLWPGESKDHYGDVKD